MEENTVKDATEFATSKLENAAEPSGEATEKKEGNADVETKEDASVTKDLSTYERARDVEFDGESLSSVLDSTEVSGEHIHQILFCRNGQISRCILC